LKEKVTHILSTQNFTGMKVVEDAPMAEYTSYKVGGPADFLIFPESIAQLQQLIIHLQEEAVPFFILGEGSNILVADAGIRGVVINLNKCAADIVKNSNDEIIVGAGLQLMEVVKYFEKQEIAGLENLSGIPGTVGGALIMNAGAFGREIGDLVKWVKVTDETGDMVKLLPEQIKFGYREAPGLKGKIIISALLKGKFSKGKKPELENSRIAHLQKRESKQPLNYGSCGSVFKRPPGNYAGALIEAAGLKGYRIGEAMVSEKHANFIVNLGHAKAADIYQLIMEIENKVCENSGIKLETEVKFIGEFSS